MADTKENNGIQNNDQFYEQLSELLYGKEKRKVRSAMECYAFYFHDGTFSFNRVTPKKKKPDEMNKDQSDSEKDNQDLKLDNDMLQAAKEGRLFIVSNKQPFLRQVNVDANGKISLSVCTKNPLPDRTDLQGDEKKSWDKMRKDFDELVRGNLANGSWTRFGRWRKERGARKVAQNFDKKIRDEKKKEIRAAEKANKAEEERKKQEREQKEKEQKKAMDRFDAEWKEAWKKEKEQKEAMDRFDAEWKEAQKKEKKNLEAEKKNPEEEKKNPEDEKKNPEEEKKNPEDEKKNPEDEKKDPEEEKKDQEEEKKDLEEEKKVPQKEEAPKDGNDQEEEQKEQKEKKEQVEKENKAAMNQADEELKKSQEDLRELERETREKKKEEEVKKAAEELEKQKSPMEKAWDLANAGKTQEAAGMMAQEMEKLSQQFDKSKYLDDNAMKAGMELRQQMLRLKDSGNKDLIGQLENTPEFKQNKALYQGKANLGYMGQKGQEARQKLAAQEPGKTVDKDVVLDIMASEFASNIVIRKTNGKTNDSLLKGVQKYPVSQIDGFTMALKNEYEKTSAFKDIMEGKKGDLSELFHNDYTSQRMFNDVHKDYKEMRKKEKAAKEKRMGLNKDHKKDKKKDEEMVMNNNEEQKMKKSSSAMRK